MTAFSHFLTWLFLEDFSVRQDRFARTACPFPRCFAADEQTMIVSAAPQVVSELDTPAAVSVVDGEGDAPGNTAH